MEKSEFDVADELLRNATSDAERKAAVSRAYFAARRHVLKHPSVGGFSAAGDADDHGRLVKFLRNSAEPKLVKVASSLHRLRILRNQADYDESEMTVEYAEDALERAADIIYELLP